VKIRADILRQDLKRSIRLVEEGANRMHTLGAQVILERVVQGTRVDTGKAVSNWRVGVGQPTRAVIEAYSPGNGGSTADANRQAALAAGLSRIASKKPGNEIFISNNVDYQQFIPNFANTVDNAITAARMAVENVKVL
jgi:hypothetical protein